MTANSHRFKAQVLFTGGLLLSALLAEFVLHAIEWTPAWQVLPVVERELGWPDFYSGYALRSNQHIINVKEHRNRVGTNQFGMRDRAREISNGTDAIRVAVMGDSYTEALEVQQEHTFTALLEKTISVLGGPSIEVLNFGVIGSGPVQQLAHWERRAKAFEVDLSLFVIDELYFRSNEITDDSANPAYVDDGDGGLTTGFAFRERRSQRLRDRAIGKVFFMLMDHSRLARAAYLRLRFGRFSGGAPGARYRHRDKSCAQDAAEIESALNFWRLSESTPYRRHFHYFLSELGNKAATQGSRVAVALYGLGLTGLDCDAALAQRERLSQQVTQAFSERGIEVLDIDYALLRSAEENLYAATLFGFGRHLGQGHLNIFGHQRFADVLRPYICAQLAEACAVGISP